MALEKLEAVVQGMIEAEQEKIHRINRIIESKTKHEVKERNTCENKIKEWQKDIQELHKIQLKG